MTEITMAGALIVNAMVVILTITLVLAAVVFSRSRARDSSSSGVVVPIIPNTSSIITPPSSSSSSSGSWKYDVFLSFRREDTRKTFVDHLYFALEQQGMCTYKDDVTLDRGDIIGPSLLKAIQESHIALIVFSENYADSSWCLDELSYIMKCSEERGQIVMPVFYNVDPSDVRKQKGQFGKAFVKHKLSKSNISKIESWKKALVDASNIAGWEPKHVANGHEAKCIKEIVGSILDKLSSLDSVVVDENLVGMGYRLEQLKSQLRIGSGGVSMVGIWGVGGGGKTTLATSIYMEVSTADFDGCCFVGNIREESRQHGLQSLQEKILSAVFHKKIEVQSVDIGKHMIKRMLCRRNVLIVLDDVDHLDQLKALAGSLAWFGDGSRIIITTRDEHLLAAHRVDEVSPISLLSHEEAVRLFNMHASNENNLVPNYEVLSQQIVTYAAGLPLALIVLGSFLYDKDKDEWLSTLARLKDHPEMEIVEKLKISYDGLKPVEKELFLDIACFCMRMEKDEAIAMLDACGFHPRIGVKVLIQKALITVSNGYIHMHDLVQEMGHYIVRREHPNNPEKYSRLWRKEDIEDICSRNATLENDKIEAIDCYDHVCSSSFIMFVSNTKKLRFLRVRTRDQGEPSFLSNELRYIHWRSYPASIFPEGFQPKKLVVLKMENSLQKELWKGYKYLPCLKELQLVDASELVKTPDFGGLPCLQKLILNGCQSLEEIHQSLGNHASLVYLSVRFCHKLTRFPTIVQMEKLETLKISHCYALTEFPKIEAKMDSLVELYLDEVGIEVVPSSVGEYCANLISLKLKDCDELKSIEGNFHGLKCLEKLSLRISRVESSIKQHILYHLPHFLRKLNLSWCHLKDGDIPSEIGELFSLQELHLSFNYFTRLDFSLSQLTRLKLLQLNGCLDLVELPELPSSLAILMADCCTSLEAIREDIHTKCEWLCQVSLVGGSSLIGIDKLLDSMLQGNAIESRCTSLELEGLEIPDEFIPRMVSQGGCRLELPENWYNDFSGFLIYAVMETDDYYFLTNIIMKHEHEQQQQGGSTEMDDSQDDVHLDESVNDDDGNDESDVDDYDGTDESVDGREVSLDGIKTWVGYVSFGLLRHTSWWDQTSTSISIELPKCSWYGFKLLPTKRSESVQMEKTTTYTSSEDYYKCPFDIQHDSKSTLECVFERYEW